MLKTGVSLSTVSLASSPSVAVPSSLIVPVPRSVSVTYDCVTFADSVNVSEPSYTASPTVGTFTVSTVTPAGIVYLPAVAVSTTSLVPSLYVTTRFAGSMSPASADNGSVTDVVNSISSASSDALLKLTVNTALEPSSTVASLMLKTEGVLATGVTVMSSVLVDPVFTV